MSGGVDRVALAAGLGRMLRGSGVAFRAVVLEGDVQKMDAALRRVGERMLYQLHEGNRRGHVFAGEVTLLVEFDDDGVEFLLQTAEELGENTVDGSTDLGDHWCDDRHGFFRDFVQRDRDREHRNGEAHGNLPKGKTLYLLKNTIFKFACQIKQFITANQNSSVKNIT